MSANVPNHAQNTVVTSLETPAVNEVQRITVDGTAGDYDLSLDGETASAVSTTATAAQLKADIEGLSNVSPGDITVTGGPGDSGGTTPYLVTFVDGPYSGVDAPAFTADATSVTGGAKTVVIAQVTAGSPAVPNANAVQRGEGLADGTTLTSPLDDLTPDEQRAADSSSYGD
jgi:hypothetical protein